MALLPAGTTWFVFSVSVLVSLRLNRHQAAPESRFPKRAGVTSAFAENQLLGDAASHPHDDDDVLYPLWKRGTCVLPHAPTNLLPLSGGASASEDLILASVGASVRGGCGGGGGRWSTVSHLRGDKHLSAAGPCARSPGSCLWAGPLHATVRVAWQLRPCSANEVGMQQEVFSLTHKSQSTRLSQLIFFFL